MPRASTCQLTKRGAGTLAVDGPALAILPLPPPGVAEEAEHKDVLYVVAQGLRHHFRQVPGRAQEEDRAEQEVAQNPGAAEGAEHDDVLRVVDQGLRHHVRQVPGREQEEGRVEQEATQDKAA